MTVAAARVSLVADATVGVALMSRLRRHGSRLGVNRTTAAASV